MITPTNHMRGSLYASPLRVVIVDRQPVFREGLRRVLCAEPEIEVVGEATDVETAVAITEALSPDIVLLDVSSCENGVDAVRDLSHVAAQTRVLLLADDISESDFRNALRFGARGYASKSSGAELISKAVRAVAAGEYWISRDFVGKLAQALADSKPISIPSGNGATLTAREREIARLLAEGMSNRQIAETLSVSQDTVKHHLTSAFSKIGVSSRIGLALRAIDGSLDVPPPNRTSPRSNRK